MNDFYKGVILSILRKALTGASTWAVTNGWLTGDQTTEITLGAAGLVASLLWTFWEQHRTQLVKLAALQLPQGSTLDDAKALSKTSSAAPASTPNTEPPPQATSADVRTATVRGIMIALLLIPAIALSACALKGSARHHAVIADTSIHAGLAALQDVEAELNRAGVPAVVANHRAFNAQLVPALETGDALNRLIRDWPVDKPAPAELPLLASRLQGLTRTVAGNLPESEAKSKLLTRIFAVSDVVLNLLLTLPPASGSAPMLAPAH